MKGLFIVSSLAFVAGAWWHACFKWAGKAFRSCALHERNSEDVEIETYLHTYRTYMASFMAHFQVSLSFARFSTEVCNILQGRNYFKILAIILKKWYNVTRLILITARRMTPVRVVLSVSFLCRKNDSNMISRNIGRFLSISMDFDCCACQKDQLPLIAVIAALWVVHILQAWM